MIEALSWCLAQSRAPRNGAATQVAARDGCRGTPSMKVCLVRHGGHRRLLTSQHIGLTDLAWTPHAEDDPILPLVVRTKADCAIVRSTSMIRFRLLIALIFCLVWSHAMAIDEPPYTVVRANDVFEVRRYEPYLVAETQVDAAPKEAGNRGFRILAGYIFGGNKGSRRIEMTAPVAQTPTKIAMTAPVAQTASAGGYLIQFAMPREWTLETLPEPTDSRVTLRAMPARTIAVIRYSGTWSQRSYEEHLKTLQDALAQSGLAWHGEPMWARYDPPWKPWFLRRNEIWLELDS
jgi:hypothetical protein